MSVLNHNIKLFQFFEELTMIPRGSYNEEKVANYLVEFAKKRNLRFIKDDMNNVIIFKEASKGYENHETIMLQGHSDMVNEKNKDCLHNFDTDPLELILKDNILSANGTTLGADDGCGIAIMLAILDDKEAIHPPLECVFTVQEEVGLFGAMGLDTSVLNATRMIGLDSSNELQVTTSSSGGKRVLLNKKVTIQDNLSPVYKLTVKGLSGGHSGGEIHKEKGNAIQLNIRLLRMLLKEGIDLRIVNIDGGLKDNAIARECVCSFASDSSIDSIENNIDQGFKDIREQYLTIEPNLVIELEVSNSEKCMSSSDSEAIINTVYLCPNGMIAKSMDIENLTLISLNSGTIKTFEDNVQIVYSLRSPLKGALDHLTDKIEMISKIYGFTLKVNSEYGGWAYDPQSQLRKLMKSFFKEKYNIDLKEYATHGGLESGVFKAKMPMLDIVAYGPNMYDIHSPDERLEIDSFERVYHRIKKFLEVL